MAKIVTKGSWSLQEARLIAEDIVKCLAPHCHKIDIAGSIRREMSYVGDIEVCSDIGRLGMHVCQSNITPCMADRGGVFQVYKCGTHSSKESLLMKNSYVTATDIFCGAGGSSQGARAHGVEVKLALNHWNLAIRTHQTNFPDTDHDCADVSGVDPRRYNSTDILIASPECTNHSLAKGKPKPKKQFNIFDDQINSAENERSRATMWDVPRFAEYHDYNIIVTENVVDAKRWVMYDAWILAMQKLGYTYKEVFLNSQHFHPTPQSRDRLYVVFWKKGNKAPNLEYTPLAWCPSCEKNIDSVQVWKKPLIAWGKYRTQYTYNCPACRLIVEPYYYAAFNCINFAHKSERIGDRKTKLAPNTERRIEIGVEKYWNNPFLIYGGDKRKVGTTDRAYGLDSAIPTQCAQPWHSVISPFIQYSDHSASKDENRISEGTDSLKTQTTTQNSGVCMPPMPFIIGSGYDKLSNSIDPAYTQSTQQNFAVVNTPFTVDYYGVAADKPTVESLPTQQTIVKHALVFPPFIVRNTNPGAWAKFDKPMGTQIASAQHSIISPPFQIELNRTGTARDLTQPISTQLGGGKHNAIITNEAYQLFIGHYYKGAHEKHFTEPIGSCSTKDRHYAVMMKAGEKIKVEDCYYRMIKADEVGRAMAFERDYVVHGNERQQVRQYGNAVTPPVMQWIISRCVETLKG